MKRVLIAASLVAACGVAVAAQATARSEPGPIVRPITVQAPGPHRLAVDAELLVGAAAFGEIRRFGDERRAYGGLSDLRLFERRDDGTVREVPYLLMYPPERAPTFRTAEILAIAPTKKTSGFEADFGETARFDRIRIEGLPAPFLKRLRVEGSGDRARWTLLAPEATLFDLPDDRLRQLDVPFSAGEYRYLRVTWDDTNSGIQPLPPRVLAREITGAAQPAPLLIEARIERRPSEPGISRYRLTLPASHLPVVALTLDATGGHVFRDAAVFESRLSGTEAAPVQLGRATIARVVRQDATAAALRIPINAPRQRQLDLIVEDGNNPPLEIGRAAFETATLPWIYFEAPSGALQASYGGSAAAPSYDLEAARSSIVLSAVPEAAWGSPSRPDVASSSRATPAPPDKGAAIDVTGFRFRRAIAGTSHGLVAVPLDAAALAHSRGPAARFSDVRIVDGRGRQVPYILERRDEPLTLDITPKVVAPEAAELKSASRHVSVYSIALPYPDLPSARLVLETSDRVFRRTVTVGIERPADRRHREAWLEPVASASWAHADEGSPAPALTLPIEHSGVSELRVAIDEGDNRPLALTGARVLLPSWRLRFYGTDEPLTLIYGHDEVSAPRYDLALLAARVMGDAAAEIEAAPEGGTDAAPAPFISPRAFWIALAVAALVILALIVKLVATASGGPAPPSQPAP